VLGGVSGLVLALAGRSAETRVKQIFDWCGAHLLEKRTAEGKAGYRVWSSKHSSAPLTGLGHGAAGIAPALTEICGQPARRNIWMPQKKPSHTKIRYLIQFIATGRISV
jgi:lantibiotic modifying enzyme